MTKVLTYATLGGTLVLALALAQVASAGQAFPVQAGSGSPDQAVQIALYYPQSIAINVGDTVKWADDAAEWPDQSSRSGAAGRIRHHHLFPVAGGRR